jgi:hypothetical protein
MEPGTYRLVAQYLNQLRQRMPPLTPTVTHVFDSLLCNLFCVCSRRSSKGHQNTIGPVEVKLRRWVNDHIQSNYPNTQHNMFCKKSLCKFVEVINANAKER